MALISAESGKHSLKILEELLWDSTDGIVGPRLVRAMFRNPHWVDLKKWEKGVTTWIRSHKLIASELVATFLFEMGYVRGDYGSNDNRERALVLLDAAEQLERKREPDGMILRNLRIGLENLARAGFVESKERAKIEKKLKGKDVRPNALMKLRRTFTVDGKDWAVTTIDVEGPRAHAWPLVVLCDPDANHEHWLPWLIEADAHFRCYLVEYGKWHTDMDRSMEKDWQASLAFSLHLLTQQIGLKEFGLLAQGWVSPVGAELCRRADSRVAFVALDSWDSAEQIIASVKGAVQDEDELEPAARNLLQNLRGNARPVSGWLAHEYMISLMTWWLTRETTSVTPRDAYARQVPMLPRPIAHVWHPCQRLANYDFKVGEPIAQPVLVLSSRWPEAGVENDSRLRHAYRRPYVPELPLGTHPAWTMPTDQWMAQIVAMLEAERMLQKR